MTDAQAPALPRLSVGDRVRVIARLDIPDPHDLPIGYIGVVEEVFPNGDVDLGEWACRRDEVELAGDELVPAASAPTGDMVLVPRRLTDEMYLHLLMNTDVNIGWERALAAAPSHSASTMGVKELEWLDTVNDGTLWKALTPFFAYAIEDLGANWTEDRFWLYLPDCGAVRRFETLEAAKAAAQSDFTRRIQSCLSSAGGEGTVEALPDDLAYAMASAGYDATRLEDGTPQFAEAGFCVGHAVKIYEAMEAVRLASLSPSKAETETASANRDRALHDLATALELGQRACDDDSGPEDVAIFRQAFFALDAVEQMLLGRSTAPAETASERERLVEAARDILSSASNTYRKGNGQIGTLQGDDGDMMWIVPFDEFEALRAALSTQESSAALASDGKEAGR